MLKRILPSMLAVLLCLCMMACGPTPEHSSSIQNGTSGNSMPDNPESAPSAAPGDTSSADPENIPQGVPFMPAQPYDYTESTSFEADDRSLVVEDTPQTTAEAVVLMDFIYSTTAEFERKREILPNDSADWSFETEQTRFDDGIYTLSRVIHTMETLTEERYIKVKSDGTTNPYYCDLGAAVAEHSLDEYYVVLVEFTEVLSEETHARGPQWGDGTFENLYLVGRTAHDDGLKIYSSRRIYMP